MVQYQLQQKNLVYPRVQSQGSVNIRLKLSQDAVTTSDFRKNIAHNQLFSNDYRKYSIKERFIRINE